MRAYQVQNSIWGKKSRNLYTKEDEQQLYISRVQQLKREISEDDFNNLSDNEMISYVMGKLKDKGQQTNTIFTPREIQKWAN